MPDYRPPAGSGSGGGTPDDNSVTSAKIVDGTIVNADVNAAAAIAYSKLALTGSIVTGDITDGTILGGDLSSTIAIPSAATATTQSAADGSTKLATTSYVDTADALKANLASPTFTGHPVGVTETALNNSTRLASTAYVDAAVTAAKVIPNGVYSCISPVLGTTTATLSAAKVTTLLVPTFHMLSAPPGTSTYTVSQMGVRVGTQEASSTAGIAIYTITWTGVGTFSASLVYQLNAALATTSGSALFFTDGTTGAPASGAGTLTLDFKANQYMVGCMASSTTTVTLNGVAACSKMGALVLTSAARSSTTDWPATITDSSGATAGALGNTNRLNAVYLVNADGKNYL